jgi:hypothetical protein
VDNEAGKMAVCWRNHVYIDPPTACSGEFHFVPGDLQKQTERMRYTF